MYLRFEGITKRFGGVTALDDVSLTVDDGEFVVLLGPSGCGKSTLLRIAAGLEGPDSGRLTMDGRDITRLEPRDRDVAMVFQNYALYPHMTVGENIGYPLKVRKQAPGEIADQVAKVAGRLGLEELIARRPRELSGGQRQRVALARAIVRRPKAFLMDEPLSNLDARLRVETRGNLKHLQRQLRIATLYVTHDQAEAMTLARRIAVMNRGRIQQYDTPARVYQQPFNIFVAGFVGSPSMNLISGEREGGEFRHRSLRFALDAERLAAVGGVARITLGVRPEDVEVERSAQPGFQAGRIFVTEEMGDETFLIVDAEGASLTVRVPPEARFEEDAPIWFRPRPQKVHLFDTETGNRLERPR